jgi:alkanesulfonate monooxygenase SsuD/methylene tetrahydromethanopterin reductase-like flavin-dependent oxidoreductase (luciferase family)
MIEFGFGLVSCERYPGDQRSYTDLYEDALGLAQEAERLGYESIWVSEHHFFDDGYMPSLLPVCAAMAAVTSRIRIGTGALLAPLYDPIRLAEDAATVDLISRGRLILGLAQGWRPEELEVFGVDPKRRHRRLEETVTILRQAWSSGQVDAIEGRFTHPIAVTPKPAALGGPPIWIAALAEPAIRRAGRIADGYLGTLLTRDLRATATPSDDSFATRRSRLPREVSADQLVDRVGWVREELENSGRNPEAFTFAVLIATLAWPGGAWARVRDHYYYSFWKYEDMANARGRHNASPAPPPSLAPDYEQELLDGIVMGTPEQVAETLIRFHDRARVDLHYIARSYWPGLDPAFQREAMAVFADEVMPLVRAACGTNPSPATRGSAAG